MKQSSFLALIGVGLIILDNLFYLIVNSIEAWQYDWYRQVGYVWSVVTIIAWVLIGQFFYTLYKKSK